MSNNDKRVKEGRQSDLSILEGKFCVQIVQIHMFRKYQIKKRKNWPDERLQIVWLVIVMSLALK